MNKGLSYVDAKKLKKELEHFINLVDNYQPENIEQWIIKSYAKSNSIVGVLRLAYLDQVSEVSREKILKVLNEKDIDELHTIIKRNYKNKLKKRKVMSF